MKNQLRLLRELSDFRARARKISLGQEQCVVQKGRKYSEEKMGHVENTHYRKFYKTIGQSVLFRSHVEVMDVIEKQRS